MAATKKNLVRQLVDTNKNVLLSMIKIIEFCGKQGLPLHDPRDGGSVQEHKNPFEETATDLDMFIQGNLAALNKLCIEAGDTKLGDHIERCKTSQQFSTKKAQDQFLDCIKEYIQHAIVSDVTRGHESYVFGIKIVELTNVISNEEQVGILVRYLKNYRPVERLIEVVKCEDMNGKTMVETILNVLTNVGLNPQACRSVSFDVMGNMSRYTNMCASLIKKEVPNAHLFYCVNNNLNVSFCKSSKQHEFQSMISSMKELSSYFRESSKRHRRLEQSIGNINQENRKNGQPEIRKSQVQTFCRDNWLTMYTSIEDFLDMYVAIIDCLESILREKVWDLTSVTKARSLVREITSFEFIAAFQTNRHFYGYLKSMSVLLQGTSQDVLSAFEKVGIMRSHFAHIKENSDAEFEPVYENIKDMCQLAGIENISTPCYYSRRGRKTFIEEESPKDYLKRVIFLPFTEHLIGEFDAQFNANTGTAVYGLKLIPGNIYLLKEKDKGIDDLVEYHQQDLPAPTTFAIELKLWKKFWSAREKPTTLQDTIRKMNANYFPNIHKILCNLLTLPVTVSGMTNQNSPCKSLHYFKQSPSEPEHDCITFLFVHKDVILDYEHIIASYTKKYPKRMKMLNPFAAC